MAKTEYKAKLELIHSHKLYIWSALQLKALNYFRHNKPLYIKWLPESKIVLVPKHYPHIETSAAALIQKYALGPYYLARLLFRDETQQIWICDAQLNPICNITSWAD